MWNLFDTILKMLVRVTLSMSISAELEERHFEEKTCHLCKALRTAFIHCVHNYCCSFILFCKRLHWFRNAKDTSENFNFFS